MSALGTREHKYTKLTSSKHLDRVDVIFESVRCDVDGSGRLRLRIIFCREARGC